MSSSKLARTLIRLYPRAWRERYGEEFLALLDETRLSWWQVPDIVRAATNERVRAAGRAVVGELSERAMLRWRLTGRMAAWTAVAAVVVATAWLAGQWFVSEGAELPARLRRGAAVAMAAAWIRLAVTFVLRARLTARGEEAAPIGVSAAEATAWSVMALAWFTIQQAVEPSLGHLVMRGLGFFWMLGALTRPKLVDESRLRDLMLGDRPTSILLDRPVIRHAGRDGSI